MQIKNIIIPIKPGDLTVKTDLTFKIKSKQKTIPKLLKALEQSLKHIKEFVNKDEPVEIEMNINDVNVSIPKADDDP